MVYNNLYFFDKFGESLNLQINPDSGAWEGTIYFDQLSVSLFDNENLFILEKVGSQYKFPTLSPGESIEMKWEDSENSVFFLYDVTKEVRLDGYFLDKKESITVHYDDILPTSDGSNIDIKLPLQVNIAFNPDSETEFTRTLNFYLKDDTSPNDPKLIAKIGFYGEGEYEDDRFRIWLQNFGIKFNATDANILAKYDIKEAFPDWKQINESRKAILVNQQEIYPYIGTYKGLVNFIDMLGYKDALHIQEYWKNVNKKSQYYKKLFLVDLKDILDDGKIDNINLLSQNKNLKFGKQFAKTEFLALTYEFTKTTDEFDDDGIPEVVETTEFTVDEIFYKLHKLSEKVKNEIIPVNVIIKDIIGEFIYFQKITIKFWKDDDSILSYNLNEGDRILCNPDETERLTLRSLDPMYRQEYKNGVDLGVVQFNQSYPDPYEFAQYYGPTDVAGIIDYIGEYYEQLKDQRYPNVGAQLSWDFGDDPDKKIGAPVVLSMDIDKFTFKTFRGVTWQDVDSLDPSLPIYWTLQNLDFRNIYEITWSITKPTPKPYNFKYRGKAIDFHKLPHFLPYAGEYTIHLDFHTFNGDTIPFTKQITVDDAQRPEIIAFSRLEDKFNYRIDNLSNIQLQDFGASTFYYPRVNVLDNEDTGFDIYKNVMEWESFFQNRYGTGKNIYDVDLYDTTTNTYVPYNDPSQGHPKQDYWGLGSYDAPFKLKDFAGMTFDDAYFMRLSDLIYQGDFNAGFYMTTPTPGDTITISLYSPFTLPSFSSLQDLADKLNASDHSGIRLFNYEVINEKIHAQAEYFSKEMYHILYMPCPGVSPGPGPPCINRYITYAAGLGKKVYKLIDFKEPWIEISPFSTLVETAYLDIMSDPNDRKKVVVCGLPRVDWNVSPAEDLGAGIRVSHDAGTTWFEPGGNWADDNYALPFSYPYNGKQWNDIWYLNSNVIYVIAIDGQLVKSTDGGLTFNTVSYCPTNFGTVTWCTGLENNPIRLHAIEGSSGSSNDDVIIVIRDGSVYKSSDGGTSWNTLNGGIPLVTSSPCPPATGFSRTNPGIFISADEQTIIAVFIDSINGGGIFKSVNGGTTFDLVFDWTIDGPNNCSPQCQFVPYHMTWNPTSGGNIDHFWIVGGEGGLSLDGMMLKTTDGGTTWDLNITPWTSGNFLDSTFLLGAHFHTVNDGYGVGLGTKSISDGGNTIVSSPGTPLAALFTVWTGLDCGPPDDDTCIGAITYSVGNLKNVNKLVDLKGPWIDVTPIFPSGDPASVYTVGDSSTNCLYMDVQSDPNDPTKVVACGTGNDNTQWKYNPVDFGAGIRVSHDAGDNWFRPGGNWRDVLADISPGCKEELAPFCTVFTRLWYLNSDVIYVISWAGDIIKSTDGGLTFNIISNILREITDIPCGLYYVNMDTCIHAVEGPTTNTNDDIVIAGVEDKIYKSIDGGSTWITLNGGNSIFTGSTICSEPGDPSSALPDVFISKDEQTIMVLGVNINQDGSPQSPEGGVFKSIDGGTTFNISFDLVNDYWLAQSLFYWPFRMTWNPSHDGTIDNFWVAHTGIDGLANYGDLITHSSDGGNTWTSTQHPSTLPVVDPSAVRYATSAAFHSATDGFIGGIRQPSASIDSGIRRTSDAGVVLINELDQVPYYFAVWLGMWTTLNKCEPPKPPKEDLYITYSVGTYKNVNKLVDLKGPWIDITPIFPGGDPFVDFPTGSTVEITYSDVQSDPNDPTRVIVCGTHNIIGSPEEDFGAGIRVSYDAGTTWFQPGGDWLDVIDPDVPPGPTQIPTLANLLVTGPTQPNSIGYAPSNGYIYISYGNQGKIKVYNNKTLVTTINVGGGKQAWGMTYATSNGFMYIYSYNTSEVFVIDTSNDTHLTTIAIADVSRAIEYVPTTNEIWVSTGASVVSPIQIIDCNTNTVVASPTFPVSVPQGFQFNSIDNTMYVTTGSLQTVEVMNVTTRLIIATVNVGTASIGLTFYPVSNKIYVSFYVQNFITIIDCNTNTVSNTISIPSSINIYDLLYVSTFGYIYFGDTTNNMLQVINPVTELLEPTLAVPTPFIFSRLVLAYDQQNFTLYVSGGTPAVVNNTYFYTSPPSSWCEDAGSNEPCMVFTRLWYLNSDVIYVISFLGDIIKSTDGGLTFNIISNISREVNSQPCRVWILNMDTCIHAVEGPTTSTNDDIVIAGVEDKIYKSIDGGSTWITLNGGNSIFNLPLVTCPGPPAAPYHTIRDVFISKDEQTVMVFGMHIDFPIEVSPWVPEGGVFKSTDGGATFNVTFDLANDYWPYLKGEKNFWPFKMTWNPSHDGTIDNFWVTNFGIEGPYANTGLIAHSSDGGNTWISTQYPPSVPIPPNETFATFAVAFHSATDGFIGGYDQPLSTTENKAIRRTSDAGATLTIEENQIVYPFIIWIGMWTGFRKGSGGGGGGGGSPLSPGCEKGDKYTFFHPRGAYSKRLVDYLKTTFPPFDEETLFLFAKTSDMISGAVQDPYFWVDTDYWRYKDDRQRGFLPTTIDENAFSITRIKMFNERFEIPKYAPMFFIIDNLDAKQEFIWTLIDQITGEEIIKVKGVPFFIWKFKDLGKFTLSVEVTDSADTAYYQTMENLITVSDKISYTKNVERKLNYRKIKGLSS